MSENNNEKPFGVASKNENTIEIFFNHTFGLNFICSLCSVAHYNTSGHSTKSWVICDTCWDKLGPGMMLFDGMFEEDDNPIYVSVCDIHQKST